jgi:hypothetical protein
MTNSENKTQNDASKYENMDPYIFITKHLIPTTKDDARVVVCIKPESPKIKASWDPVELYKGLNFPKNSNLYISLSSVYKVDDPTNTFHGQYRNQMDWVAQTHMFMLDDLGDCPESDKPDYHDLPIQPTWVIETSPDNHQVLYVLAEPLNDKNLANQITKSLAKQANSDKSAVNAVRWARLPGGINNKEPYITDEYPEGFVTRIKEANPDLKYHTSQIIDAFNLNIDQSKTVKETPQQEDKPLVALEGWSRHLSALSAISADCDYDTWQGVAVVLHPWGDNGLAAYIGWSESSSKHTLSEQEITEKFNQVSYDILNPQGHTNIRGFNWLAAKARDYGWDYDQYSVDESNALITEIDQTTDIEDLEDLMKKVYDAFLSGPDHGIVVTRTRQQFKKLGTTISLNEIRALISSPKKINPEDKCWTYPLTDEGNLLRFHAIYDGHYFYIPEFNHYLLWKDGEWVKDPTTQGVALHAINQITKLERNPLNEVQIEALHKWRTK